MCRTILQVPLLALAASLFAGAAWAHGSGAGSLRFDDSGAHVNEAIGLVNVEVERSSGENGAVSVTVSSTGGTATPGSDYEAVSQLLEWADGDESSKIVHVVILADSLAEGDETIELSLSGATGGAMIDPSHASFTITVSDSGTPPPGGGDAGSFEFDEESFHVDETAGMAVIRVERSDGHEGAVSVSYSTSDGTATAGADYTATSGTLSWAAGEESTKTFTVPILEDQLTEGSETVHLTLSDPTGGATIDDEEGSALLTIREEGGTPPGGGGGHAGVFKFDEHSFFASESGGVAVISVERSHGESGAVSVAYSTSDGTASAGTDYTATSGTLSWAAGEDSTKTFTVPIFDDGLTEGPETVHLTLSDPTGGATVSDEHGTAVLTILDGSDPLPPGCESEGGCGASPGVFKFDEPSFQVLESQAMATIEVERSHGESGEVSVTYTASAGSATAGEDFDPATGVLTWGAGDDSSRTFTVAIHQDTVAEGTETIHLALSDPTGGATVHPVRGSALLSIVDDDGSTSTCVPGGDHLCLLGGRFRAEITFRTPNFGTGVGQGKGVSLSDKSGLFWFFDPTNAEMLIKVIDGCGIASGPAYWVFYAATTNVDFTLTVTDTRTGISKQFFNPLGKPADPIQDVATFKTCQ